MKQARNRQSVHPPVGRYVHQIEVSDGRRLMFIVAPLMAPELKVEVEAWAAREG